MREGFWFENAEAAMKFFERCKAEGAVTQEDGVRIFRAMVAEKKEIYLRDVEEFTKDKAVLKITIMEPPLE